MLRVECPEPVRFKYRSSACTKKYVFPAPLEPNRVIVPGHSDIFVGMSKRNSIPGVPDVHLAQQARLEAVAHVPVGLAQRVRHVRLLLVVHHLADLPVLVLRDLVGLLDVVLVQREGREARRDVLVVLLHVVREVDCRDRLLAQPVLRLVDRDQRLRVLGLHEREHFRSFSY